MGRSPKAGVGVCYQTRRVPKGIIGLSVLSTRKLSLDNPTTEGTRSVVGVIPLHFTANEKDR